MIVAVDFDNTLIEHDEDGNAYAVEGAAEAMKALKQAGCHLAIHTCRIGIAMEAGTVKQELDYITALLRQFGIPFDEIYLQPKPVANFYIDDRAIAFEGDWDGPLRRILDGIG
jgi:histidinol phosphatase-like enzyme